MKKSKAQFTNSATHFTTFLNATPAEDGWMHLAPVGDFEGVAREVDAKTGKETKTRAIQRLDKAAIAQMCNSATSRSGLTKFLKAPPLFLGHPNKDPHRWPDAKPKGVFTNFKQTDQGLFGEAVLTDEGEQLVASKRFPGISGHWDSEDTGEKTAEGLRIFRPLNFLSAGLVLNPNLPTFLNESMEADAGEKKPSPAHGEQADPTEMKKEKIIALFANDKNTGIPLAADATDTQTEAALDQLAQKAASADTLKTQFNNERQARIDEAISGAIASGRITGAEKPDWERRLKADFANEFPALGKLTPKVKTETVIDRGNGKNPPSTTAQRTQFCNEVIDELATKHNLDRAKDYNRLFKMAQEARPDLFQGMKRSAFNKKSE